MSASACFPTRSEYIIMTLPVVLWIPDLKGQRQLSVKTLSQSNSNGRGRRILNRPGPSLPSKEEALGDEEILPKGNEGIHAPNNCLPLSKLPPTFLTGRLPNDLPPRTLRGMGQTEDIQHSLPFQTFPFSVMGLQFRLGPLRTLKMYLFYQQVSALLSDTKRTF